MRDSKYCWDILSIIVAITSTAIAIYFGEFRPTDHLYVCIAI
ncbi:DUF6040 family protein [uncultured Gemmiger sp.]|nr:DUF6040 family protein [uncultured Gemmiger sp.]